MGGAGLERVEMRWRRQLAMLLSAWRLGSARSAALERHAASRSSAHRALPEDPGVDRAAGEEQ